MKRSILIFALWATLLGIAHATTFTVSNTNDSGTGSLRQAILSANADATATAAAPHQINFTVPNGSTIAVISPFLVIANHVSINGLGMANLTISGGGTSRIFWIQNGTITIQNLTLANGYAKGGDGSGGGMGAGGAIFMHEGKEGGTGSISLSLTNVNLSNNRAVGGTGGITYGPAYTIFGGGGMGGNGGVYSYEIYGITLYDAGGGGVLGNGSGGGGSVTNANNNIGGNNGGLTIFGNGGDSGGTDGRSGGFGAGGGGGTTGGNGGFGAGGGGGNECGHGGFGGGGGGGTIGGNGGFGGGGGRGTRSGGGGFGAGNGGMGAGGGIFVASGRLNLTGVTFNNNSSIRGNNGAKGYGGALFVFNKADNGGNAAPGTTNDPVVSMCNVTFNGNTADDDNNTHINNDNYYASSLPSLTPRGYITSNGNAVSSTICSGRSIQLVFNGVGTEPFYFVVNGKNYNTVSGSGFATLTEGTDFTGTQNFNLTRIADANNCAVTSSIGSVIVNVNEVNPGSIGEAQSVCSGGDPQAFNSVSAGTGGGVITYRWEKSTTDCNSGFLTIMGATGATYDAPAGLTQMTHYRRVAISNLDGVVCEATSNCVTVSMRTVSGGTVSGSQLICTDGNATAFTSTEAGSGQGTITYRWESSTTDCISGYSPIMGATGETYDPPAGSIGETTFFRRVTISTLNGTQCQAIAPNCIVVIVLNPQGGAISGNQSLCSNANPTAITSTSAGSSNAGTITYRWESSTTDCNSGFSTIMGATDVSYDPPAGLSSTTYFRRVTIATFNGVGSGVCEAISNCVTITIQGFSPPTITCPATQTLTLGANCLASLPDYRSLATTDDDCGVQSVTQSPVAGTVISGSGNLSVTLTVTDINNLTNSCIFTVTKVDNTPPTVTCPANISVNSDKNQCFAVVSYNAPVSSNNCSAATTVQTTGLASGSAFPVGTTTNTFEVTSNGQKTTCSFTVTVVDAEPPTITCPANISVNNDAGQCSAVVTYTAPVGSDNCSGATTKQIAGLASGAAFPVGTTTNTFEVTANGQKTSCSFTVTVVDAEPPMITCPANIVVCANTLVTYVAPVGTDNCSGAVTTQTSGLGTGVVYPVGVTTNTFKVTAANGQTTECSFTVTVIGKPTITLSTLQQTLTEGNNPVLCDTDANPVNSLQFNVSGLCVSGSPVWRVQVGSGAWSTWSATAPVSQPSNNQPHRYQAACDASCTSTYSGVIELTINNRATVPQNVSLLVDGVTVSVGETKEVCSLVTIPLTFNANCAAGEVTLYSVDGGEYSSGVPTGLVDNQYHNYRVRCRKSDGTASCVESESGVMRLKLVTIPSAPTVSLSSTSSCDATASFSGQSSCGTLRTVWYNAATNVALPNLPSVVPSQTTSYYARCQTENGCVSEKSNVVTFTLAPTQVAPVITASQEIVCTGTSVTISANCPAGSQTFWNTGVTTPSFEVSFNNVTKQTYWAKCIFVGGCQSSESVHKDIYWNAFVVTLINVGESKSSVKVNDRAAWTNQFITRDGGPELEQSTQQNPTLYYVENANKIAPRYWTINVEACGLSTDGSLTFDMLATPEMGVIRSFNTHENNAPYFMYANREGWTELYAQNHPAYGFYQDNGAGGNVYDTGLPKGLYKLGIRYWDMKGWGSIYPSTRKPQGSILAYQEYWFRIQSKDGVGVGAARTAEEQVATTLSSVDARDLNPNVFAQVMPNPVSTVLRLQVQDRKGQSVQTVLTDASGRQVLRRMFVAETNTHQEEFGVSELPMGMYFLRVTTPEKQTTLKVVKVGQ